MLLQQGDYASRDVRVVDIKTIPVRLIARAINITRLLVLQCVNVKDIHTASVPMPATIGTAALKVICMPLFCYLLVINATSMCGMDWEGTTVMN